MTLGATVVLALVAAAIVVLVVALQPRSASGVPALADLATASSGAVGTPSAPPANSAPIIVHVLGAVAHPGVFELGPGGRVVDAIAAAGGTVGDADLSALNLARTLVDGEQVYVPLVGETPPAPIATTSSAGGGGSGTGPSGGLINLNSATLEELDTLPRIGPALAQRIIDHRETNGPFTSVDELADVAGIGDATLEGLRDLVTV